MLNRENAKERMNHWGSEGIPFLFFTDFEGKHAFVEQVALADRLLMDYDFNGVTNRHISSNASMLLETDPVDVQSFESAYDRVLSEIRFGNSFLTNLTFETRIDSDFSLTDIFNSAGAKYKLRYADEFVCFSPETFIQIRDDKIRAFPMKGTIEKSVPDAEEKILNDPKEAAEHITIVDLIRNDLSMVAENVQVERFRYIEEIVTGTEDLLQVSSEIVGDLDSKWNESLGDILFGLLPAGSISGAPKTKTIEIIKSAETHVRGFYTGVCGIFDGVSLDSGVMIRFIEKRDGMLYYKSGGGITAFSEMKKEYEEYLNKIYVPVH